MVGASCQVSQRAPSVPHLVTHMLHLCCRSASASAGPRLSPPGAGDARASYVPGAHGRCCGQCRGVAGVERQRAAWSGGDGALRARPQRRHACHRRGSGGWHRRATRRLPQTPRVRAVSGAGADSAAPRLARRVPRDHRPGTSEPLASSLLCSLALSAISLNGCLADLPYRRMAIRFNNSRTN